MSSTTPLLKIKDLRWHFGEKHCTSTGVIFEHLKRIQYYHDTHIEKASRDWIPVDSKISIGMSVQLLTRQGSEMYVGMHEEGWALIHILPPPARMPPSDLRGSEIIAFSIPEWTEFRRNELVSPEAGRQLLCDWLETGATDGWT